MNLGDIDDALSINAEILGVGQDPSAQISWRRGTLV